jgi:tetratricopeptide (TPR) repeat protein
VLDILTWIVGISLFFLTCLSLIFAFPVLLYYCYTRARARGYRAPTALMLVAMCWAISFLAVFVLPPIGISLFFLTCLSLVFAVPVLLYYYYTRARARGYRVPAARMLVVATCWAVFILAVFVLAPSSVSRTGGTLGIFNGTFFVLYGFGTPTLAATACTVLLLRVLPSRSARVSGPRHVRIPFVRIGQILIGLNVLFIMWLVLAWLLGGNSLGEVASGACLLLITVPTGLYLIDFGRRQKAPPFLADLLDTSSKPIGALYLRSFRQESQFFVIGPASQYGAFSRSWHATVSGGHQNVGVKLEEYFSDIVGSRIGPLVALGCPEDYVVPDGATRLYAKDTEWMERLDNLARRASCILMEVGSSQNLRWELEHIRHEGLQEKLFVLTRPSFSGSSIRLSWWFWNLLWRMKGIHSFGWREFADNLAQLGYSLDVGRDPGSGAVVSFDGSGTAILLTTGAQRPQDFVEPIQAWITKSAKSGSGDPLSSAPGSDMVASEEALAASEQALRLDPNDTSAWNNKGNALRVLQRYKEALAAYEQALRLDPNYALAWNYKGVTLFDLPRYQESMAAYEQALRLDPNDVLAWNYKGTTLTSLKRYEEALAALEQALRLDPNYALAWNNKGVTLFDLQRYEEALAAYEQAIRLDPNYALAWNNKGTTLLSLKRYEEALAAYEQAIRLDPNYALAWNNKGITLDRLGKSNEARQAHRLAHQLSSLG